MTCTEESVEIEVTSAALRHAMGHFATGVTVITSVDRTGRPVGTTANAVSSLSLDPPLLLVCFDRSSQTLAAIGTHGAFAVNILAEPQKDLAANFARRGLAADWNGVPYRPGLTGSPRLDDVLATVECTVEHRLPGGDHEIVIGRVRHVQTSDSQLDPLLFWRGRYACLGELVMTRWGLGRRPLRETACPGRPRISPEARSLPRHNVAAATVSAAMVRVTGTGFLNRSRTGQCSSTAAASSA
jgi:3-hydroxy-9,10-secoandrosta-1,3,5(10)-triene-9,17-dione monooxygenase reductase component